MVARSGSPAVIKGMNPFFPCCFRVVKASAIRPNAFTPPTLRARNLRLYLRVRKD